MLHHMDLPFGLGQSQKNGKKIAKNGKNGKKMKKNGKKTTGLSGKNGKNLWKKSTAKNLWKKSMETLRNNSDLLQITSSSINFFY